MTIHVALGSEVRIAHPLRTHCIDWLTSMDQRPVGWYRDPDDTRAHRYWDGQTWAVALAQSEGIEGIEGIEVAEVAEAAEALQRQ